MNSNTSAERAIQNVTENEGTGKKRLAEKGGYFKLIDPSKNTVEPEIAIIAGPALAHSTYIAIYAISGLPGLFQFAILSVIFMLPLRSTYRKMHSDWVSKEDVIGLFSIEPDQFQVNQNGVSHVTAFHEIEQLNIHHNYIQGRGMGYKDIVHNGIATIEIHLKDRTESRWKILIEHEDQIERLKELFKALLARDIQVTECFGNSKIKTYFFKYNLTYSEIQELKKELGIESQE